MAFLPVSPLSPQLPLVQPSGSGEARLGPIPNVADGIPGIGGIGRVELPGIGVFTPGGGGLGLPSLPNISLPAPSNAPSVAPITSPAPEVTPFPGATVQPTTTPTPTSQVTPVAAPTPVATAAPQPTSTPVPNAGELQPTVQGSPYSTEPITTTQTPSLAPAPSSTTTTTTSNIPVKQTTLADTFGQYLKAAASNYNDVQTQADSMIQHLAVGDKVDIHDVALAVQKAALTNQLAVQVRNRLVEAYQEVMRMPV